MLQINALIYTINPRFAPRICPRITTLFASSSTTVAQEAISKEKCELPSDRRNEKQIQNFNKLKLSIYNSLKENTAIASEIKNSNNINDLLNLMKLPNLSQNEIVKVMKSIIKWVNENKNTVNNKNYSSQFNKVIGELTSHHNVNSLTENEIVAKYSDLSTVSMMNELLKLAQAKRRNPKELKYLIDNIRQHNKKLTVGQYAGIMYSIASLSYIDEVHLDTMSSHLVKMITSPESSPVRSILKSMSILQYKNTELLIHIYKLLIEKKVNIKSSSLLNYLQCFALLDLESEKVNKFIEIYRPKLTEDLLGADKWLYYVWYLVLTNCASNLDVSSVLNQNFISKLYEDSSETKKNFAFGRKLLYINAAAKYILNDYYGPLLAENSQVKYDVPPRNEAKTLLVNALQDTLQSISPSEHFHMNVNTNMGFLLDAEYYINSACNFVSQQCTEGKESIKLAILIYDYHSYYNGSQDILSVHKLEEKLLKHSGYKVLSLSYKHFGIEDDNIKRGTYLRRRIQELL